MKMKSIKWNTNRTYTDNGQRIAAVEIPNGGIYFADVDRGIDGVMSNCELDRNEIMRRYDNNQYRLGVLGLKWKTTVGGTFFMSPRYGPTEFRACVERIAKGEEDHDPN